MLMSLLNKYRSMLRKSAAQYPIGQYPVPPEKIKTQPHEAADAANKFRHVLNAVTTAPSTSPSMRALQASYGIPGPMFTGAYFPPITSEDPIVSAAYDDKPINMKPTTEMYSPMDLSPNNPFMSYGPRK